MKTKKRDPKHRYEKRQIPQAIRISNFHRKQVVAWLLIELTRLRRLLSKKKHTQTIA